MPRRLSVVLLLLVAGLVMSAVVASAHPAVDVALAPEVIEVATPSTEAWRAADARPTAPWALVAMLLAVLTVGARRPRGALAFAVALCLALCAFENGVHSVHHLNDDLARASCAVATATAQVAGTVVDSGTAESLVLPLSERLVLDRQPNVAVHSLAVHQGRAPPLAA